MSQLVPADLKVADTNEITAAVKDFPKQLF